MNFKNRPNFLGQHWKIFGRLQFNFGTANRKSSEDFGNLLPFFPLSVKVNIASSKWIWGHGGRFDGIEEVSSPFSWRGEGEVVRFRGVIKEKSPDFISP